MRKKMYLVAYAGMLIAAAMLQSCNDDVITPNTSGDDTDTTWVDDSTNYGGNPVDSTGGNTNPVDSTDWSGGNDDPIDSTDWSGGNGDPIDSTGWNPYDSTGFGG